MTSRIVPPLGATFMIQGASSSVGKSLLVTAFCRIFARRGLRVAPFKAQNMSNNAAVCPDGGEVGRAQALQSLAAGIPLSVDLNPILLKPEADHRSQVIVHGRPWKTLQAGQYYERKRALWSVVTESLDRLRSRFDLVVIEGAGSPAELNLAASDVVNMAVARYAQAPVALVGDIDRGGVFAQLLGTLWLLPPAEQALIKGLIVNKFRGDPALFVDGVKILEERSGRPVLGVIPYLHALGLPEEDAATLEGGECEATGFHQLDLAVIRFPHIANFDDLDPLRHEPGVRLRFVDSPNSLGQPDALILPGSKSTVADLAWLRAQGLADLIVQRTRAGLAVVGICGGYQMLGRSIRDPGQVESDQLETEGLGLLPIETTFEASKTTSQVCARVVSGPSWLVPLNGLPLRGYEIHMGRSTPLELEVDFGWLSIEHKSSGIGSTGIDGATTRDGRVWGCYLHGLFDNDAFRQAWLRSLTIQMPGVQEGSNQADVSHRQRIEAGLDRLADTVEREVSIDVLMEMIRL